MSVDGSFIQANADHHSRVPPEQLAEVAKVNHTVREYLAELEQENPVEPPVPQQDKVSTTDPDSTYATKGGPARLGYYDNYLVDNASCVIVGVQATPARLSQESAAARDMIERYRDRHGRLPQTLAADTTYGNGELLQWLEERARHRRLHPGERKSQWAAGPLWHRPAHLRARGEWLSLPGRQIPEVRRH
jgi:hypothetical protein